MQILTFTQKLLRQRRFLSSLIPLFALFFGLGASQSVSAQRYLADNITISSQPNSASGTTSTTYNGKGTTAPLFNGAILGGAGTKFTQTGSARGSLLITGANALINPGGTTVAPSALLYRVYLTSATTIPAFSSQSLSLISPQSTTSNISYGFTGAIDLLQQPAVLGGGTYIVEIQYQSTYDDGFGSTGVFADPGVLPGYKATFVVEAPTTTPAGGTTNWISDNVSPKDTRWNNPANWSNGVPTRDANANIPGHAPSDPFTIAPLLNDPSIRYEVQTLTLLNADNNERAIVRIGQSVNASTTIGATLYIYGDLNNLGGGVLAAVSGSNSAGVANPALNSTLVFTGDANTFNLDANSNRVFTGGNQIIRGLTTCSDIRIDGIGIKGVINTLAAPNTLTFAPTTTAIVRTTFDNGSFVRNTSKTAVVDIKDSGVIFGERGDAFIDGITLADGTLQAGVKQTFGNIGIDITPNRNIPSPNVVITRTIGAPFQGPVGTSMAIRRQYGVSGDVNNATISTITFHYFNTPFELNGNAEANLTVFKTSNNGIPFQLVGGSYDGTMSITRSGIGSLNTLTLGDKNNPLPVTLTSFGAKRVGADAVVNWETASELNNKGYNVQVSTDGKAFRTIGFVVSESANSTTAKSYSFTDTEKNKVGVRYYRLQQVDVDGKNAFFAPRAVTFEGRATASGMLAYPNPFTSEVRLNLTSATEGNGLVRITDMTGRLVGQRQIAISKGANDVEVTNVNELKSGLYLMNVALPNGETKTMKLVKQ